MSNIGFATLSVIPSMKGFQTRLSAGVSAPMTAAGKDSGKKFGDAAAAGGASKFKDRFKQELKGFSPLAGLAIGAGAFAFFKGAIDQASDLAESGNKIDAIFGDAATRIQDYASGSAQALGQTRLQALDAASTFGTFGKAAGLTGDQLAGFSTKLVGLSTDMASFFNTDVSTAIEAIGSGLRGEAEPLRQFGVLLDDATLRQEALRQGLVSTTKDALTPQQKVLAAYQVILKQTGDAQGDFERTSNGLANQQRILSAQWTEMQAAVGAKLLPAMTSFVSFLNQSALPALGEAGGVVEDAAQAFASLPGPVKSAALAFGALRLASATGLTAKTGDQVKKLDTAYQGLTRRIGYFRSAFQNARGDVFAFGSAGGEATKQATRLSASLTGIRAAASGAGGALRRGLGSAVGLLGGPWGIAIAGATAAVAHFWQENQEAKARVEQMTAALNAQTGALTSSNRALVRQALVSSGAADAAESLGVNLQDVFQAALGNAGALDRVNNSIQSHIDLMPAVTQGDNQAAGAMQTALDAADKLRGAINGQNDETAKAIAVWRQEAAMKGNSSRATQELNSATDIYRNKIRDARDAVMSLFDAENKRRLAAIQSKRDQLALIETMKAAEDEARRGKRTLDQNTQAGRDNWNALLDIADQWANTKPKVQQAEGAYSRMRQEFIKVATQMGATRDRAKEMADRFLQVPKNVKTTVTTPGMERALSDVARLKAAAEAVANREYKVHFSSSTPGGFSVNPKAPGAGLRTGGYTGNAPVNQFAGYVHGREYVLNAAATDYYGLDLLNRMNKRRAPKRGYRDGGFVEPAPVARAGGVVFTGPIQVYANDPDEFLRKLNRRVTTATRSGGESF